eukprot:gb/GEZN01010723.1/.p1 GENE.gb/GEZN01010723.1/~~gb/GEZN01010723.1/.p1  ORF type:complete len:306 (-),score=43.07 gb/GEZN01010723.1/:123-1040(-)
MLRAEYAVGQKHTGSKGGNSNGDVFLSKQQLVNTLGRFEDGTTNVLVSTGVLEEGLDIPLCGVVVMLDCSPSGSSAEGFLQKRGRARAKTSRIYAVVANEKERNHIEELKLAEQNMRDVIKIFMVNGSDSSPFDREKSFMSSDLVGDQSGSCVRTLFSPPVAQVLQPPDNITQPKTTSKIDAKQDTNQTQSNATKQDRESSSQNHHPVEQLILLLKRRPHRTQCRNARAYLKELCDCSKNKISYKELTTPRKNLSNQPNFFYECKLDSMRGIGEGSNKKQAQEAAAEDLLDRLLQTAKIDHSVST